MFHTYVINANRQKVDLGRAKYLMDRDLLKAAERALLLEQMRSPGQEAGQGAQWLWDCYTGLHREKYGADFAPDLDASVL